MVQILTYLGYQIEVLLTEGGWVRIVEISRNGEVLYNWYGVHQISNAVISIISNYVLKIFS